MNEIKLNQMSGPRARVPGPQRTTFVRPATSLIGPRAELKKKKKKLNQMN